MVKQSRLGFVAGFLCTLALVGWMSGGAFADVKDKDAARSACCAKDGASCGGAEGKGCCAKAADGKAGAGCCAKAGDARACAGHCGGHTEAKSCGKGCCGKATGDEKAATSCGSGCCKGRAKASAAVL
jgi:hypothetical protein